MKTCCLCKIEKPESEFNKRSKSRDGLDFRCRECSRKTQRERASKMKSRKEYYSEWSKKFFEKKAEFINSRKKECAKCGDKRVYLLDFHHIDPKQKKFTIASKTSGSMDDIDKEIQKCVCLCRNCHAEFHHFYGMSPESPTEAINEFLSNKL